MNKQVTVIDAQGGGVGKAIVRLLKQRWPEAQVLAVGTNAMATAAMIKAGADAGATGENAVVYNCRTAGLIIAPLGMALANAMYGEVSPSMSAAVSSAPCQKVLIPVKGCREDVVGLSDKPLAQLLQEALDAAAAYMEE